MLHREKILLRVEELAIVTVFNTRKRRLSGEPDSLIVT